MDNSKQEINKQEGGPHAQQAALQASAEMKRKEALTRLETLVNELHKMVKSKSNIHTEIKSKTSSAATALGRFIELDDKWQASLRRPLCAPPEKSSQMVIVTVEEMDTGVEGDGESVAGDKNTSDTRPGKKRERSSPDPADTSSKKKKDSKQSPPQKPAAQNAEKKKATAWKLVQSKKEIKKQKKEQLRKEQPKKPPKESRPEPKRKKPRKLIRPYALIIRPVEKAKYAEILRQIKKEVPIDQVRNIVDKINKTKDGNMLITLSRKSTDKGRALQKIIAGILQQDAEVICKGPQERVEVRDIDDTTTKDDIRAALLTVAGESGEIPLEAIKIRKAYRGTQTAVVTLPAITAQKVLDGNGKIRIGWVNCRIRATKRPIQCFKCWHFGHLGPQCKSEVDRSKLCIRCGQEGHKIADCRNSAKCALCAEQHGAKNAAHHAGSNRCAVFKKALEKLTNKRT